MKKLLLVTLALLVLPPASAQQLKPALNNEIDTYFPDNNVGAITPGKLRTVFKDVVASYVDWLVCTGTGGTVYWSTGTPTCLPAGTSGQVLTMGAATPSWASFASNLVAGTGITITGTSPATISLTNQITAGGPVGDATHAPIVTYNAQGQLTAVSSALVTPAFSSLTGSLSCTQTPALTGDVMTSAGSCATTLSSVVAAGGPTGSATVAPIITYDAKGRLTAVSSATITPAFSSVTGQASLAQLPSLGSGSVYANLTGGSATPLSKTITEVLDSFCTAQGSVLYRSATVWTCLAPGTSGQVLQTGGPAANPSWFTVAGTGTVTSVGITAGTGITQSGSPVTTSGSITVNVDKATAANYYAAASNKVPTTDVIYPSEVTITYGATTTIDFDTLINGAVTLTGNITTLTVSNARAGKAGQIRLIQDATGSRTWPSGGNTVFKYAGGTLPNLSTTANAVDVLTYSCSSATFCVASLLKDVRNP